MKNLATTLVILAMALCANAQNFKIKGLVTDDQNQPLPGANVVLQYPWGEMATATSTEPNGIFKLNNVEKGGYSLVVTFLGFEELKSEVTVTDKDINLSKMVLSPTATTLGEVTVKEQISMGKVGGDTIQYNADAFKVMKDASAQDLIEKMPTVTTENGTVKAQGESIQQVLVDGKPFFGNDPAAALKNLPAELIEKVQIFDQQSEQSQFTGVQDGNTTKTINIVTRKGMNNGQFGKVYAGYGWEDKYQAGGNTNIFNGDRRISLIGMTNNINVQNFNMDDILGVSGSSGGGGRGGRGGRGGGGGASDFLVQSSGGIATTHALGVNYTDKWGEKMDVTGSYFFNLSQNKSIDSLSQQFVSQEGLGDVYVQNNDAETDNTNHRLNFRITWEIDSANSILIRPRATWQLNDGISSTFGQTALASDIKNQTNNKFNSNYDGLSFNNSVLWRHKFSKQRRTFSIDFSNGYNPKSGSSTLRSFDSYYFPDTKFDTLDQKSSLTASNWNMAANFEYTEPLTQYSQLLLNYKASYQQEESDKQTYDFWPITQDYALLNPTLSNVFSNDYVTQSGGAGYNYSKGRDFNWNVRANYQWSQLVNQPVFPEGEQTTLTFSNVLPSASLRYNLSKQKSIRFNYRTNTQLPSVSQLQNVVDNTNPLQLSTGNPALVQSYQHNMFMRYQTTNTEKSTVFFAMAGGGLTGNYIGNSTWYAGSDTPLFDSLDVSPGAQIKQPVNLDGYRSIRSFMSYGFPIKLIKSNLSFNFSYNYGRSPGLVNGRENISDNHTVSTGITLASNISEKIDFNISLRPGWNKATNSLQTASNSTYFSQNSSVRFNWIIYEGLVLRTDVAHQYYNGLSDGFDQNYVLWNLAIGKKLFKNERGEIALAVNDLLNENRNITRSVTETYIQDSRTNALQRFVMLSFTYNIRVFGTAPQSRDNEERRWEGRPPGH
ncbi:MAG: outer membrane beta-barrel protein [Saprospiraceae bacterium]|nr:outer membrane beta-barrel protein [Saprospiraceae bacterium]MCF8252457.1 outer membrane beta-barrel protein [Saprospiraceae bacterium]MCF8282324.1 outer membrane beta-barrel protein [Bacteroidales bacterium]MCF8314056.1 outer membrane beta-barrel protein [Saprospiraceae bacterium]MCF8442794.1 outer membrane beta-barrel protein [Saprospiraceae bacterium]